MSAVSSVYTGSIADLGVERLKEARKETPRLKLQLTVATIEAIVGEAVTYGMWGGFLGGIVGSLLGGYFAKDKDAENTAEAGGKVGSVIGSVVGAAIGGKKGYDEYTVVVVADYTALTKPGGLLGGSDEAFLREIRKAEALAYRVIEHFIEVTKEDKDSVICPVDETLMLCPTKISVCQKAHTFGARVIRDWINQGNDECPTCRAQFTVNNLVFNDQALKSITNVLLAVMEHVRPSFFKEGPILGRHHARVIEDVTEFFTGKVPEKLPSDSLERIKNKQPLSAEVAEPIAYVLNYYAKEINAKNAEVFSQLNVQIGKAYIEGRINRADKQGQTARLEDWFEKSKIELIK